MTPNLKLTNKHREDGGQYFLDPTSPNYPHRVKSLASALVDFRAEEADMDWHYETCGTQSNWHRIADGPLA